MESGAELPPDKKHNEILIKNVKREVKKIMEEAVTKRFVNEESNSVTSLCGAVEACLSQGIKRRVLGLFKTSSTTALLHKVAKNLEAARVISKQVLDLENSAMGVPGSDSVIITRSGSTTSVGPFSNSVCSTKPGQNKNNNKNGGHVTPRYLWIRLALFEKVLAKIIDHLVNNSGKYYEKDALVADPDYGSILSSLLVGPCALDYSKIRTVDSFWNDPPADELVQRHRISSGHATPPTCRKTAINFGRTLHAAGSDDNVRQNPVSAKNYVESLHQNSRATLLYGKNNVLVLPKDVKEPMAGYLSLHQTPSSLIIKWTPNELMNTFAEEEIQDKSRFWDYALNMNFNDIVYVHCHQKSGEENGGTIVLVGQDGVQRSPIHFPKGGHMLSFLACLENGLLPHGQLDPSLWSQRGKGKVFPKLKRKCFVGVGEEEKENSSEDVSDEAVDYVFQIINKKNHKDYLLEQGLLDLQSFSPQRFMPNKTRAENFSSSSGSSSSSKSSQQTISFGSEPPSPFETGMPKSGSTESLSAACDTMRRQILSRAFYGWLAYCRHLKTVQTHLSGLVLDKIMDEMHGDGDGLTKECWQGLVDPDGRIIDPNAVRRKTYYGGVGHELRKIVWPFLLGHYDFGSTKKERVEMEERTKRYYETTMTEWLAVEAIVRQKDKEIMAANVAKLSSESSSGGETAPLTPAMQNEISNDVFEVDISTSSDGDPPVVDESQQQDCGEAKDMEELENDDKGQASPIKASGNSTNAEGYESPDEGVGEDVTESDDESKDTVSKTNFSNGTPYVNKMKSMLMDDSTDTISCDSPIRKNPRSTMAYQSLDSGNHSDFSNDTRMSTSSAKSLWKDSVKVSEGTMDETLDKFPSPSPTSSQEGGVYSAEILENFGLNMHRIDKDVQRCDRNYSYFTLENLEKLRNIMCTYVWENLEIGYMQGMCDLVAPLLVIFDDESLAYACFCNLMERLSSNFPHNGEAMDRNFANMRSLIQILDPELFQLMDKNSDYTHFFFCYRWFLLDFKRELLYDDVFVVWETIWAAKHVCSGNFYLFFALALVETYRDIIIGNQMEFTEIIKFFNDMAERHDAKKVLQLARNLVVRLHNLIEDQLST